MKWNRFGIRSLMAVVAAVAIFLAWYTEQIVFPDNESSLVANFAGDRCVYEWEFDQPIRSVFMTMDGEPLGSISSVQLSETVRFFAGFESDGSGRLDVALGNAIKTNAMITAMPHDSSASTFHTSRKIASYRDPLLLYSNTWLREGKGVRTLQVFATPKFNP